MSKLKYFCIDDIEPFPPFPEDGKKEYNDLMALWLTECAILAYEHPQKVMGELASQGFTRVIFFNDSASQGFLACHPEYKNPKKSFAILAFRGTETEDYKNILTDVIVLKRPLDALYKTDSNECGMVHGGFLTALNNIWGSCLLDVDKVPEIKIEYIGTKGVGDAIEMIHQNNSRLYVTGHSLGGAMATLAAYRLKKKYPVKAMYTVGSPRVLSHGAVEIDSDPCPYYRIVNAQDLVPRVPLFGFQHVGQEVYLTKAGEKGVNPFNEKFLKWLTLWGMIVMIIATMCGIEQKKCGNLPSVAPEHLLAKYFVAQNAFACHLGEQFGIPSFL
ncbi:MAG: lipase family protein, partial [Candidatus Electrothrix sp. AR5]|nr:lipase family protein [Candidatus Electrothrix sp. AR5]